MSDLSFSTRPWRRRVFVRSALSVVALSAGGAILGACGSDVAPTATAPASAPSVAAPTTAPTVAASTTAALPPATAATGPTAMPAQANATAPSAAATVSTTRAPVAATTAMPAPMSEGFIPSPAPNVPDAYTKLPPPFTSVAAVPGKGKAVSAFLIGYNPPVPGRAMNKYWQELERRLGVTWEPTITPAASYVEKLAALVATGSLPDLTFLQLEYAPDHNRLMLQGAYADLTPFLTGDALKEYPNLARFPPQLWKNVARKGRIYGVPSPNLIAQNTLMFRQDWAEKVGFAQLKNADDFYNCMVAFNKNDPDGNGKADSYGLGSNGTSAFSISAFLHMFRVPNGWRKNADGSLTNMIETDEYRNAVTFMRRLYEGGGFHPDIATITTAQSRDYFIGSKIGAFNDGITALTGPTGLRVKIKPLTPAANVTAFVPPGFDGGKATYHTFPGYNSMAAMPARVGRDAERTKELLRVLDYFAAPFGSEEYNFLKNGTEGVHHTIAADGTRVRNDLGNAEIGDLATVCTNPPVMYYAGTPEAGPYLQGVTKELLALGVDNPTVGFFSPTDAAKTGELSQLNRDRLTSIVAGREPLNAIDAWLRDWRSRGGDTIRMEYQQALKEQ